jgi:ATP-dependent helicase/nuclease subunit A
MKLRQYASHMSHPNLDQAAKTKLATDPHANIAVFASAGSGKTYLLVHRVLKLLLGGVEPSNILAITFTRKAAAEMQERLMSVLAEWASADDSALKSSLKSLLHPDDDASIAKARKLYEELLFAEYEVRITTFHAFCQDILKRFAIHAGVPAGFRVAETNDELKQEARKKLYKLAQQEHKEQLSTALFTLLKHCNTVHNVNEVLDTFIDSRSDWWSFTEHQDNPVEYAEKCLQTLLYPQVNDKTDSRTSNLSNLNEDLREYLSYLSAHNTKTFQSNSASLSNYLELAQPKNEDLENIISVFFTTKMDPRKITTSKALEKSLGAEKMHNLISLHESLCERLEDFLDLIKKEKLIECNHAWFYAGQKLLQEYQDLKFNQNTLDFDDLEWHTYQLLNQHESAAWIQYKLDQRIQHILIDEFQDTNPTQWNLLSPLLNELAADAHENHRSLFFVGDAKQSIYGFRRANPELQFTAAKWAKENLNAKLLKTDVSYRSSPAIIDFVNLIFSNENIELAGFNTHEVIKAELWGQVQVSQLITMQDPNQDEDEIAQQEFRNPLKEAKINIEYDSHFCEGQQVASQIRNLIDTSAAVADDNGTRAIRYSDIMILARGRTHLALLELALREQHIPYSSTHDKDFLNRLEVQDILALLTYLSQTHNDLALAQVLRSPLYAMNDQDLMEIACQTESSWHEKLKSYADTSDNNLAKQAFLQLQSWRSIANSFPVHDLLDRIYFETNLLDRYTNSFGREAAPHVVENLINLLQLSLDLDAGRYSSIQSFLTSLENAKQNDSLAELQNQQNENAVKIMTIHSAKGLEAPAVFLYDTGPKKAQSHTYKSIINWPSSATKPEQFFLVGRKDSVDKVTQSIIDTQSTNSLKEELNLLYVALTRAKQYLFISGTEAKQNAPESWHSIITQALDDDFKNKISHTWSSTFESSPTIETLTAENIKATYKLNFDPSQPFPKTDESDAAPIAQTNELLADYGTLVHKIFELVEQEGQSNNEKSNNEKLKLSVETSLGIKFKSQEFDDAMTEVNRCLQSNELQDVFKHSSEKEILKEVPISFIKNNKTFYRIIDHLIIEEDSAWIIDYKTSQEVTIDTMQEHAQQYQTQISAYLYAVKKLFPEKSVRASILFTSIPALYDFPAN